jgi:methylated-DNA-[protein]-cysteine S-methyltransferase
MLAGASKGVNCGKNRCMRVPEYLQRHAPAAIGAKRAYTGAIRAPFGVIGVRSDGSAVTEVSYLPDGAPERTPGDRVAQRALREIERYLDDPEFRFTVPLRPGGTAFQQRVWAAINAIPLAESRTYGEIARTVRSSARAVGQACGANRIALIIPCHRVVATGGSLGGFMNSDRGDPLAIKRWLLAHEGYRFGA